MDLSNIFLPHSFHHQKSHLIRHYSFISYTILFLVITAGIVTLNRARPTVLGYATNITVEDIISDTNVQRLQNGDQALKENQELDAAARAKAADMFAKDYWAHFGPDGEKPWDFITAAGYVYSAAGENLARDFDDSQSVVTAWMNSPSHRENLLNKNYQDIGVAVVNGTLLDHQTTLVVQEFGRPFNPIAQLTQGGSATASAGPSLQYLASGSGQSSASGSLAGAENNGPPAAVSDNLSKTQALFLGIQDLSTATVTKLLAISLFIFIIVFLIVDTIIIRKRGVVRIATHSFAHVAVLAIITLALLLLKSGNIL